MTRGRTVRGISRMQNLGYMVAVLLVWIDADRRWRTAWYTSRSSDRTPSNPAAAEPLTRRGHRYPYLPLRANASSLNSGVAIVVSLSVALTDS